MDNNQFDIEYIDVIQYLNKMTFNKSFNFKFKDDIIKPLDNLVYTKLSESNINICKKSINDIIKLVNQNIKDNDFNKESLNISAYDGFERVQRELGLAPSLYPKFQYDTFIFFIDYRVVEFYEFNNSYKIKMIIEIGRKNKIYSSKNMVFTVSLFSSGGKILIEFIFINGFINKNKGLDYLYLENNFYNFSTFDNKQLYVNKQNYNELMAKYNERNQIMQTPVNNNQLHFENYRVI